MDFWIVLGSAVCLQTALLFGLFLGYECDAAHFLSIAKRLVAEGGLSAVRPPLFPAFLALTGVVWPGTFAGVVLAQAAMGVAIPLFVYRILRGCGRPLALAGSLLLIVSTIPFVGAKLILAEQLFAFLTVLTVFFLADYQYRRDPRAIYGFLLAGLAAMLTRWEAEFIFTLGMCGILALAVRSRHHFRHVVLAIVLALLVLGSYSVARAISLHDLSLLGTLQSGTGHQLFNRLYGFDAATVDAKVGRFADLFPRRAAAVAAPRLIHPANGSASRRVRDIIAETARTNPEIFRARKPGLMGIHREADAPTDPYEELFGRFEGHPDALADEIFRAPKNFRTAQYAVFVNDLLTQELGFQGGDRLQIALALESIRAYPSVALAMFADGFTLTGISISALATAIGSPATLAHWKKMYTVWGEPGYVHVYFNVGGCALDSMSPLQASEYRLDQRMTDLPLARSIRSVVMTGATRNWVRAFSGTVLLFGWWILFFGDGRALRLPVLIAAGGVILVVGMGVGGGNSKYDVAFMPLLVILSVFIVAEVLRRVRQIIQILRRTMNPPSVV